MKNLFLILLLVASSQIFAARKDFKGLFGSYKREKFVENEGRKSDLGVDILLSTLFPVTTMATSSERQAGAPTTALPYQSMNYATYFNLEGNVFYTLNYNWEMYLNIGWMNYETRKQNTQSGTTETPHFHQFELSALPVVLGVKYRLSMDDFVPYVGAGAGLAQVTRKSTFDYGTVADEEKNMVLTFQAVVGVQFYFTSRAGLRLETGAQLFNVSERVADNGATIFPSLKYQGGLWSVRYASGIFILF